MIARLLLFAMFLCLWLPIAALALDNIEFSPPLASAQLSPPFSWRIENRDVVLGSKNIPRFVLYGQSTGGMKPALLAVRTDLLNWASAPSRGQAGTLYATDRLARPFVTQADLDHDKRLWISAGPARFGLMFFLWTLLAAVFPLFFFAWMNADPGRVVSPHERWQHDEAFRQKVRELEIDYKGRSRALRTHTVMLAFMGYAALLGAILLLICAGAGVAYIVVALTHMAGIAGIVMMVPIGFALKLGSALSRSRGGDSGVRLYPKDAPALFSMLEKIRNKGNGPPFERVFITGILNASVSRHTGRLGFFGFGPVTLSLGLPLMQALSRPQIEAVVSHEYGHVAARDNAFGQWVYRIRNSWLYLGERLKTEQLWYVLRLNRFYQWFLSFFNAYSFMLSRLCEYEADAFAGRIVGNGKIAEALVAVDISAERMRSDFWEPIWNKAKTTPEPSEAPFAGMASFFHSPRDNKDLLHGIAAEETGYTGTHPATIERLHALGADIAAPPPLSGSAAMELLGALERSLSTVFDNNWRVSNLTAWKERYMQHQYCLKRREELASRPLGHLSRDDLYDYVSVASLLDDDARVIEVCKEILEREPENTSARVNMLGYRLTTQSDGAALLKLEDIMRTQVKHTPVICRFALRYFHHQERLDEAKVWQFRLDEWNYRQLAADEERKAIYASDVFTPHHVASEYVAKIRNYFRQHKVVGRIYMVRKQVTWLKEEPMIVVGVARNRWMLNRRAANAELRRLCKQAPFHPPIHIFVLAGLPGVEKALSKVRDAVIYKR